MFRKWGHSFRQQRLGLWAKSRQDTHMIHDSTRPRMNTHTQTHTRAYNSVLKWVVYLKTFCRYQGIKKKKLVFTLALISTEEQSRHKDKLNKYFRKYLSPKCLALNIYLQPESCISKVTMVTR